ncbi:carboxylesterase family protein [Streptomyces sp. NPDC004610]|uniref:carboxylesterase/lipase family protein n=1 Tax=unclassified Streptomyces TaxID=2593676 RepID=UPI0033B82B9C
MSRLAKALAAVSACALALAGCSTDSSRDSDNGGDGGGDAAVVSVSGGSVRGTVHSDYRVFKGIPYAAAPVGALRWQPPEPAPPWDGIREASRAGAQCPQPEEFLPGFVSPLPQSEDCLSVNIWAPSDEADRPRPVLVWIHGGGNLGGNADLYDAQRLVTQGDVVVVTLNYRLGALGWLADPALAADGKAGNYGALDQQAALRWVRDNIAAFGGDPAKVTVGGESAGALGVCTQLAAPGSDGLFRAAIIQSAPCSSALSTTPERSRAFAVAAGCADPAAAADCLRRLPVDTLLKTPTPPDGPVAGGPGLPVAPAEALANGAGDRRPVLIGDNTHEGTFFTALQPPVTTDEEYARTLDTTFPDTADRLRQAYPVSEYGGDPSLALSAVIGDSLFSCSSEHTIDSLRDNGSPVYQYEFADTTAPAPEDMPDTSFPLGASHTLELRYLFDINGIGPLTPAQQRLADQMVRYWAQFIHTGDPATPGQTAWPPRRTDTPTRLALRPDGPHVTTDPGRNHHCDLWPERR